MKEWSIKKLNHSIISEVGKELTFSTRDMK